MSDKLPQDCGAFATREHTGEGVGLTQTRRFFGFVSQKLQHPIKRTVNDFAPLDQSVAGSQETQHQPAFDVLLGTLN